MSTSERLASVLEQWMILRSGSQDSGVLDIPSLPLSTGTNAGPLRLAVGPNGEAKLLLPVVSQEVPGGFEVGDELAVTVSSFILFGRAKSFLDLTCLSMQLEPVFGEVVDEIVARVSKGIDSIEAARSTLEDFRALLTSRQSTRIDRNRVLGLVAELLLLNRLLDLAPSAWRTWRGPAGDRHDFREANTSLEVKASLRVGAPITVNGVAQLEPPSGGTLHLAHFILEPVSGGRMTVAALGRRALALADNPAGLSKLLCVMGCPETDAHSWNQESFRLESECLYRVDVGFPRIVPSLFISQNTPVGVRDVTYRIDLSVAESFKCSADEFNHLLRILVR